MRRHANGWCALMVSVVFPVAAQVPIALTALDSEMTGPRTKVLVLGSVHLGEVEGGVRSGALDPLLDKLVGFKPDVITVEALSGEQCDLAARHPSVYGADYCADISAASAATGLDIPSAIERVNATFASWPAKPAPAQRRQLAAWMLAAHDRPSAYVQWLRLPADERRAGDGLDASLVAMLKALEARNDESYQVGARLAARLGLERVHAIDDHTGDNITYTDRKAFATEIERAWKAGSAQLEQHLGAEEAMAKADDLLPLYRTINTTERTNVLAEVNVAAALRAASTTQYPQIWVRGWEIRNLRMVANIEQTFRERPGARVLCIVGASHKPWFDQWLGQLQGVDIVDVGAVLR